jgi:tripartite-type tricarboxylate transporter receptor subunit TctC
MNIRMAGAMAAATFFLQGAAYAQDPAAMYPSRPVKIIVGYQAGGPTDAVARLLATQLQATLGQPCIVENRPGAGSNIASELVATSAADGYTLLIAAAPITMNGFLYKGLKWDVQKSFEPISMVMSAPSVLAVAPTVPANNLQELIALAKKQPGALNFGSSGNGGSPHVAGEMFKQRAGIDIVHIPYKGTAGALQDLMAGQITMSFLTSVSAMPYLKSGKVRPIAVASPRRLPQMRDVPTLAEAGLPGVESDSWNGLFAPKGTPSGIVAKLHAAVAKAAKVPELREKLESQGAVVVANTPAEFSQVIKQEVEHWSKVLPTINVKMD